MKPILDSETALPLYEQLMLRLRQDIARGLYPVHSRIPSEMELCRTYGVSRVTVRKALGELTREGLLVRHQGKGTFVGIPRLHMDLKRVTSFHDACRAMHCIPSIQLIRAQLTVPDQMDLGASLSGHSADVVEIVRVLLADGIPVALETNHFSPACEWLLQEDLTESLYSLLRQRNTEPDAGTHEISLDYATAADARLLGVNAGDALLCLHEIIYDQHGHPLHTSRQRIRGDRFSFRI